MNVHGFDESNITVLMDDGQHTSPTKDAIIAAYEQVVSESKPGDAIFLHYSGHGSKVADSSGDEDDGYDEVLVPLDFQEVGMIADDDLYRLLVKGLPQGVHVVSLVRTEIVRIGVSTKRTLNKFFSNIYLSMRMFRWIVATRERF